MLPFARVTIIGIGLIGSSIARATRASMPTVRLTGYDAAADVRATADALHLFDDVADSSGAAVIDADLVILCVPVGAMGAAAADFADDLPAAAVVSDVGSCKAEVVRALREALPGATIVPAHPVAGTERSGPEAGFATLFHKRWCILTPPDGTDPLAIERVAEFWRKLGAEVETMAPDHHDRVLAITSHLPHLEVIKYSAGGFRDFTRIAASDPTMWRDVFLANREAVLEMLQRFSEDLSALQRAIRWGKGDELFDLFSKTRAIRRGIIEQGQDDPAPDFGRTHD